MITVNQTIKLNNKISAKIIKKLGEGGQGQVYIVDINNKKYAMKLLVDFNGKFIKKTDKIARNIETLINMESPHDAFIWPLFSFEYNGQYGYIMNIIPSYMKELSLWLNADPSFRINSTKTLIDASLNIIDAFNSLRLKGYSYQDLNAGNVFVDTYTGDVKICDCDNICPTNQNYGVYGKKGFQAPEVILGKAPDLYSDIFSLAMILYYIWCKDNPFDGQITSKYSLINDEVEMQLYGRNPIFCWSPLDESNRPDEYSQQGSTYLYPELPVYIQEAFTKTFTDGIKDRQNGRMGLNEWYKRFLQFRCSVIKCEVCGEENIFDNNNTFICDKCRSDIKPQISLNVNTYKIPLYNGAKLKYYHINLGRAKSALKTVGRVIQNAKYKNILGIKNLSNDLWLQTLPGGKIRKIRYNEVAVLFKDCKIDFYTAVGAVVKV